MADSREQITITTTTMTTAVLATQIKQWHNGRTIDALTPVYVKAAESNRVYRAHLLVHIDYKWQPWIWRHSHWPRHKFDHRFTCVWGGGRNGRLCGQRVDFPSSVCILTWIKKRKISQIPQKWIFRWCIFVHPSRPIDISDLCSDYINLSKMIIIIIELLPIVSIKWVNDNFTYSNEEKKAEIKSKTSSQLYWIDADELQIDDFVTFIGWFPRDFCWKCHQCAAFFAIACACFLLLHSMYSKVMELLI